MTEYENTDKKPTDKGGSGTGRWPPFHWLDNPDIRPIVESFWRANYDERDLAKYDYFLKILRLSKGGLNGDEIGRTLHMNNVRKYLTGEKMSFLTNLRAQRERLGRPFEDHTWIPTHLQPRGTPSGSWLQVPKPPMTYDKIHELIQSIESTPVEPAILRQFGFESQDELQAERTYLFGFFLGAVVGDSGKHLKGITRFVSRSISLVLSFNKPNSLRFGEFTTLCANASLDLGMHRLNDLPPSPRRFGKTGCYAWRTASSPIGSWVFNECLGLKDGETTTYDPLLMGWLLDSPRDFAVHFMQGLAESDGWPDAFADKATVVSSPNTKLFKALLENLGCPSRVDHCKVELLTCDTEDAFKLPFFSPRIRSNLYEDLETLAKARRYPERKRLPQSTIDLIREFAKSTTEASEICLRLARTTGYKVSGQTVRKYMTS